MNRIAAIACPLLLLFFTATAWMAVKTKSATYDEPYHGISAWLQLRYHDFRFDNQDPPLWQYWAALPNGRTALSANFNDRSWMDMPNTVAGQWYWGVNTLYRTRGNDAIGFINRSRVMMLVLAVLLGILICVWTWQLAGPIAAIMACFLFCLDPNFLAHSALMKNDVVFSLSMFALTIALWKAGRQITVIGVAMICVLCIVTLTVKFSGIVAALLVPLILGLRAMTPQIWPVGGRNLSTRLGRLMMAAAITALVVIVSYAGIWAVYGFRFRPTPLPGVWLNLTEITDHIRVDEMIVRYHGSPPAGASAPTTLPPVAQAAVFANQHGLFPQAYLAGFLFTYATAMVRYTYLCGQYSVVGWWWYFPFTILVKTPIATLLMAGLAIVWGIKWMYKNRSIRWSAVCLLVPIALFLASVMSSDLNIGLRHILPIYPFAFVGIGWIASVLWQQQGKKMRLTLITMGVLLAAESLSNFPNFIPFFNFAAAGNPGGKLALLGDSNLDWGQDLPALAQWQTDHPALPLYLCYFGFADPAYYGIHYIPLPGGYRYDTHPHFPDPYAQSVLAISATNLQGILLDQTLRKYYANWAARKPREILGGSIYLYDFDPMQMMNSNPGR